jgi:hypothetical protein
MDTNSGICILGDFWTANGGTVIKGIYLKKPQAKPLKPSKPVKY